MMNGVGRRTGYLDMFNEAHVEVLWKMIASRDRNWWGPTGCPK